MLSREIFWWLWRIIPRVGNDYQEILPTALGSG